MRGRAEWERRKQYSVHQLNFDEEQFTLTIHVIVSMKRWWWWSSSSSSTRWFERRCSVHTAFNCCINLRLRLRGCNWTLNVNEKHCRCNYASHVKYQECDLRGLNVRVTLKRPPFMNKLITSLCTLSAHSLLVVVVVKRVKAVTLTLRVAAGESHSPFNWMTISSESVAGRDEHFSWNHEVTSYVNWNVFTTVIEQHIDTWSNNFLLNSW